MTCMRARTHTQITHKYTHNAPEGHTGELEGSNLIEPRYEAERKHSEHHLHSLLVVDGLEQLGELAVNALGRRLLQMLALAAPPAMSDISPNTCPACRCVMVAVAGYTPFSTRTDPFPIW